MKDNQSVTISTSPDAEEKTHCGSCAHKTQHTVLASAQTKGSNYFMDWSTTYQIIQCKGCLEISFRSESYDSESSFHYYDDQGVEQFEPNVSESLYPPRAEGFKGLGDSLEILPEEIGRIYKETLDALKSGLPVLAGIGLRAILETVCKNRSATGRSLFEKIDSLVALRILTPDQAKVLHQVRTLGNDAAHEVAPHSIKQLAIAFFVVEHLLQDVYILPVKLAQEFSNVPTVMPAFP